MIECSDIVELQLECTIFTGLF